MFQLSSSSTFPLLSFSRRPVTLLFAFMLLVVLLVSTSDPASASSAEASFTGYGPGYGDVYLTEDAGSYNFTIEGQAVVVYCVQMTKDFSGGSTTYSTASLGTQGVSGDATAAWIALNHASVGTPDPDLATEQAATQAAIWVYTEGVVLSDSTVPSPSILARALEIANGAAGRGISSKASSYNVSLDVSLDIDGSQALFTAKAFTDDGTPFSGVDVAFTFDDESNNVTLATGGDGTVTVPVAVDLIDTVYGEATVNFKVPAGTLLVPADGSQIMVTASSAVVTRSSGIGLGIDNPTVVSTTVATPTTTVATTSTTVAAPTTTVAAVVTPTTTVPTPSTTIATSSTEVVAPTTTVHVDATPPAVVSTSSIDELPYTGGAFPWVLLFGTLAAAALGLLAYRRSRSFND